MLIVRVMYITNTFHGFYDKMYSLLQCLQEVVARFWIQPD
jgi:hypothetical protein